MVRAFHLPDSSNVKPFLDHVFLPQAAISQAIVKGKEEVIETKFSFCRKDNIQFSGYKLAVDVVCLYGCVSFLCVRSLMIRGLSTLKIF